MSLVLGLLTGLFVVPMGFEWLGFSLADLYNQTFDENRIAGGIIGTVALTVITYFAGRSFIKEYRSIEE
ncbi:hypothetical protein [Jeotgalibacillus sp. JSM ZJ347]|uniref:hypothetical protein n=1 Tax=Jeotgalibacillus sp. JSM ZJ347 TaxID=3342117 RepID=UPI0035A95DCF